MIPKLLADMPPGRRLWLAVVAMALGQALVLASIIWERTSLLANGREIVLDVIPVDPRSLFRGDYVILGYDISRFKLPPGAAAPVKNAPFYVTLRKSGETWQPVAGATAPPSGLGPDEVAIRGRVQYVSPPPDDRPQEPSVVALDYGIESFFVPEGTGRELERMVGEKRLSALIAVGDDGEAAIKGLISEGERVYDEPLL